MRRSIDMQQQRLHRSAVLWRQQLDEDAQTLDHRYPAESERGIYGVFGHETLTQKRETQSNVRKAAGVPGSIDAVHDRARS